MASAAGDPHRFAGVNLLLDEMYPRRLAELLRDGGHDVVAVVELAGLVGQPDSEVARWASEEGRVVVTENVVDYVSLDPAGHAGLLLVNARRSAADPCRDPASARGDHRMAGRRAAWPGRRRQLAVAAAPADPAGWLKPEDPATMAT